MSRKQHNGILLCGQRGREVPPSVLIPLLCGATLFSLARLTGMEEPLLPALTGTVLSSLEPVFGKRKGFRSGTLALLVLSLLVLRGRILDGFCQWYNGVGTIYTAGTGIVLPALEESGDILNIHIFTCWIASITGMGIAFLSQLGRESVCSFVLLLCGGVSFALGHMIDPLPLLLVAAMLCIRGRWKHRFLALCIMTAFVLLSLLPFFEGWAAERSEMVLRQVHAQQYETKYTTLPEGKLEPLLESDAPALIVTMEKPEVLYLRGFTGAQIGDDRWMPLDTQILAENQDLLYWLNSREFGLRAQFEAAASILETRKNIVTVQNVGACSAYRYFPFSIRGDDRLLPENLTDTAAGERYDSFTTVYGGTAMLPELLTALQSESSRYLQAEAAYRQFVKAHYLSIPEELAEKMRPYWDEAEGMDAQAAVKAVLENCYPDGTRHDPYYATAAVLTLRHFGIPARYAEGYITPQTTEATVELTGRHAACWAEVYHDGIGWLPMELTPGLDGEETQREEQSLPPDTPEETMPTETEPQTEPEPDGGYQVRVARAILSGAIVGISLLSLAALALLLRRRYILKKRQSILDQENIREAIAWSFADGIAVLARMGIRRENGSLDALTAPIEERFGADLAQQFAAASLLNAEALFSSHPISEKQRQTVHGFRETALELLRQNANLLRRFWMQYILYLF